MALCGLVLRVLWLGALIRRSFLTLLPAVCRWTSFGHVIDPPFKLHVQQRSLESVQNPLGECPPREDAGIIVHGALMPLVPAHNHDHSPWQFGRRASHRL